MRAEPPGPGARLVPRNPREAHMQRRSFIGGATAVLATAATSACTGGKTDGKATGTNAASTASSTGTTAGTGIRTATTADRAAANWIALGHQLDGALIRPGDHS